MKLAIGLLCVLFSNITFADTTKNPQQHWRKPFLVLYQEGADPTLTDPNYNIPWGLIAAVWDDGWMIRAKNKTLVGQTYVEGYIQKKAFKEFYLQVTSFKTLSTPDTNGIPIDEPIRVITLRDGTKQHQWIRGISDEPSTFKHIEARTRSLLLETASPAPLKDWDQKQFRP